jgi:sulfite reductase alpha subunit-like flavoprotein
VGIVIPRPCLAVPLLKLRRRAQVAFLDLEQAQAHPQEDQCSGLLHQNKPHHHLAVLLLSEVVLPRHPTLMGSKDLAHLQLKATLAVLAAMHNRLDLHSELRRPQPLALKHRQDSEAVDLVRHLPLHRPTPLEEVLEALAVLETPVNLVMALEPVVRLPTAAAAAVAALALGHPRQHRDDLRPLDVDV